jgi:diguanylate cyclase (GGDEF)-like protein
VSACARLKIAQLLRRTGSGLRFRVEIPTLLLLAFGLILAGSSQAAIEYSLPEGLSQNSVQALSRDADGFIWIATEDGLNRFDGREFLSFRASAGQSAGANFVRDMERSDQHLLLATHGAGVAVFDLVGQQLRVLPGSAATEWLHLTSIEVVQPGLAYIGSRDGLARVTWSGDPMKAEFVTQRIEIGSESNRRQVWELHAGPSGLWVGTGAGVLRIDREGDLTELEVPGAQAPFNVEVMLESPAGVLWVGGWDHGLFRLELASGEVRRFHPGAADAVGLRSNRIVSLAAGPEGVVFVGSERGLAWFNPDCDCLQALDHPRSARVGGRGFLPTALLPDERGGLFAGFWGQGLVRFSPQDRFFHVERPRDERVGGLSHARVRAVLETREGELLVGSLGGGIQRVPANRDAGAAWNFLDDSPPGDERAGMVWSLLEDRAGRVYAGTDSGLFVRTHGGWKRETDHPDARAMPVVRSLAEDAQGRLWVGSSTGLGLIDAPGQPRRRIEFAAGTEDWLRREDNIVNALHIDADQNLWVGTWAGLHVLDPEGRPRARYRSDDGLAGPIVWDIHAHSDGRVWLATSGGLVEVDSAAGVKALRLRALGPADGLPMGASFALASDRLGQLWVAGTGGLLRYAPTNGAHRLFRRSEGIAADEFSAGAAFSGRDGWVYFGGIDGLTAFDPAGLRLPPETPRPTLTGLLLGAEPIRPQAGSDGTQGLELEHDHLPLILDFSALVFDTPTAVRFRYRLDSGQPFVDLGSRHSLTLNQLPHGRSLLELEASNQGLRTRTQLLQFDVRPPLSARLGFRLLMLLLGVSFLAGLYAWRVRALTAQRARLEKVVERRTRELRAQKEALEATAAALVGANDRLRLLSMKDALTELPNRRSLISHLQAQIDDPAAFPLALVLIDIDHFKRINDGHGHQAGDEVLCDFARLLRERTPERGQAARWGGEEFLCVLPQHSLEAAQRWAEDLLQRVRRREVGTSGAALAYRISAGVALLRAGEALDAAVARADDLLYAAKAAGRDRVVAEAPAARA